MLKSVEKKIMLFSAIVGVITAAVIAIINLLEQSV